MRHAVVLYVPVLHEGYLRFFRKHRTADALFILGREFVREFTHLEREIRAVDPGAAAICVSALGVFPRVAVLTRKSLRDLKPYAIVTADEEISRKFARRYLRGRRVRYDPVFLRWDEKKVFSKKPPRCAAVSRKPFDRRMVARAAGLAAGGSDWWRRVGAVVVKGRRVILEAHNRHLPSAHTPYAEGDPRDFIRAGTASELSTALHAEQAVVGEAARRGLSLAGASIYVTVFPCPVCAKLIASAGFRKCFFASGHASLDGERVLRTAGVELALVK